MARAIAVLSVILVCLPADLTPATSYPTAAAEPEPAPSASTVQIEARATMALITWVSSDAADWVVEVAPRHSFEAGLLRVETTDSVAVVNGLSPSSGYFVRVRPKLADGSLGPASAPEWFTTPPNGYPAAAPALTLEPATSVSLAAVWNEVALAKSYEVALHQCDSPAEVTTTVVEDPAALLESLARETRFCVRVRGLGESGDPVTDWSAIVEATTPDSLPLRVATYNITCFSCGGKGHSWAQRRDAVADTIRDQAPDVLGIQEASPGKGQAADLLRRLGGPYRLHSTSASAGGANRILYNSDTVELLDWGARTMESGDYDQRYVLWGLFLQKSTDKQFLFTTTHLEPGKTKHAKRLRQLNTVLATINQNRPKDVPSIVVGDFNSHKWIQGGNKAYDKMLASGYLDPLGNSYKSKWSTKDAVVEKRVNTNFYSFNGFQRTPGQVPYHNGLNVDYIFVTPMRVSEYETVVNVDSKGRLVGTIPSDHNMLRAVVWLP